MHPPFDRLSIEIREKIKRTEIDNRPWKGNHLPVDPAIDLHDIEIVQNASGNVHGRPNVIRRMAAKSNLTHPQPLPGRCSQLSQLCSPAALILRAGRKLTPLNTVKFRPS